MTKQNINVLRSQITTISETSKIDGRGNNAVYFSSSKKQAINFDKIKDWYKDKNSLLYAPKSSDAFCIDSKGNQIFIEFKSGNIFNAKAIESIVEKAYHTAFMYLDLSCQIFDEYRRKSHFVLVYSQGMANKFLQKGDYEFAPALQQIVFKLRGFVSKENRSSVGTKLRFLEGFLFSKVDIMNLETFESYAAQNIPNYLPDKF